MVNAGTLLEAIGQATAGVFTKTFSFLLNDVLVPLIVVLLVGLFIWGQYKLLQFYIYIGKVISPYFSKLISLISKDKQAKKLLQPFLDKFDFTDKKNNRDLKQNTN